MPRSPTSAQAWTTKPCHSHGERGCCAGCAELGEVKVVPVKNRNGKVIGSKFDWDGKGELVGFFLSLP